MSGMDTEKKIYLMVATYFPVLEESWRYSFTYDQARAIQEESSYEVVVLKPDYDGEYNFRGIRVIGFKHDTRGAWRCPAYFSYKNTKKMLAALEKAKINLEDVEVAHGHIVTMAPYVAALKRRNPNLKAILQFHDADPYGMLLGTGHLGWLKKMIYFRYHRNLVEKMDILIAISKNVEKVVREAPRQTVFNKYALMAKAMQTLRHFRQAKVKDVYVLHNGVNQAVFKPSTAQKDNAKFTIGCVAVFRELKDQITLLRAVNLLRGQIPEIQVKLVGVHHSGTMFEDCKRFISENNLPVEIIPSLEHEALPAFYQSLDLFVLPSYFEGFGCVFTEAWCCGTPFITCEGQAMDDLIYPEDRKYWLCKQQNPEDLAKKLFEFYAHRKEQRISGTVNIRKMIRAFLEHYKLQAK